MLASTDLLDRLAACESAGDLDTSDGLTINPTAVSRDGLYHGAFQDTLGTWHSIGGTGTPEEWPYEHQRELNGHIHVDRWHEQFPHCSRALHV